MKDPASNSGMVVQVGGTGFAYRSHSHPWNSFSA